MRIELVRHFEVNYKFRKYQSANDIIETCNNYDKAPVVNQFKIKNQFSKIYISTLKRSKLTSDYLENNGSIIVEPLLNELTMNPIIKTKIKLHFIFCYFLWRFFWRINSKLSNETRIETIKRVRKVLDKLEQNDENVTIVGHGNLFTVFLKELRKRKYRGSYKPVFFKNGEQRVFVK